MKLKSLLSLSAMLLMGSVSSFALNISPKTYPTLPTPTTSALATDGETAQYLYNVDLQAFLRGANNYMTRATLDPTTGYKFKVTVSDPDNGLYILTDSVLKFNSYLNMFADGATGIWVDNNTGANFNQWTITEGDNHQFTIGNAAYPETVLGGVRGDEGSLSGLSSTGCTSVGTYVNLYSPDTENFGYHWAAVSVADYDAFIAENADNINSAVAQYNAQVSLYNAIADADAQYPGIDLSEVEAVYNNTSATVDELNAAVTRISEIVAAYVDSQIDKASLDNPVDYTSKIMDGDVVSSVNNWNREFTGTGSTGSLSRNTWSVEGSSDGTGVLTPFIENWVAAGGILSDQICHIDTVKVKPGAYKVTARVRLYSEKAGVETLQGASMFANFQQKGIIAEGAEPSADISTGEAGYFTYNSMLGYYDPAAETYAVVGNDSTLTFGIKVKDANYNWQAHKDYKVYYLGASDASVLTARNTEMSIEEIGEDEVMTSSLKEQINGYVDTYMNGSSAADIMQALADYNKIINSAEVVANKAAWASYMAEYTDAKAIVNDESYNQVAEAAELSDYLDLHFDEGIPNDMSLSTEEVLAEVATLQALIKAAQAATPANTDVTDKFIKNRDFAQGWTGWSHSGTGHDGAGGAVDTNAKCAEAWNSGNFDIHQDITDAPAGLYEVQVQGFYRYLRGDNAWLAYFNEDGTKKTEDVSDYIKNTPAKIFLNENTNPMANVFDYSVSPDYATEHWTAGNYYTSPIDQDLYPDAELRCYPNNMTDAGEAFDQGLYRVSAFGAVANSGDKLTIGMKGDSNQGGDSWAIFTRFSLIYRAYQLEYITRELEKQAAYLDTLSQAMGSDVKAAVEEAKTAVSAEYTADELGNSKEAFDVLCNAYALKNKVEASVAIFAELAAENAALEEAIGNTESSDETQGSADELIGEVANAIANGSYTDAEATAKIEEIKKMIKKLAIPAAIEEASLENPIDLTAFITNPEFELGNVNGWTNDGTQSFAAQSNTAFGKTGTYYAERWHAAGTLNLNQTVTYLPCGTYMITVDAHASNNGYLYANSDSVAISNTTTPLLANPENTDTVYVYTAADDEPIKIGVCGTLTTSTWFCVDNFKLYCVGYKKNTKPVAVVGDVNGDGRVDVADVNSVISVICSGEENSSADVNGDGGVDVGDVNKVISIICAQ